MGNRQNSGSLFTLELKPPQSQRSSTVHRKKSLPHSKSKDSKSVLGVRTFKLPLSSHPPTSAPESIMTTPGRGVLGRTCSLEPTPLKKCYHVFEKCYHALRVRTFIRVSRTVHERSVEGACPSLPLSGRQSSDLATYHCLVSREASRVLTLGAIFSLFPLCFPRGSLIT